MTHSNLSNSIPCEICNRLIDFDEYIEHLERCYIHNNLRQINRNSFTFSNISPPRFIINNDTDDNDNVNISLENNELIDDTIGNIQHIIHRDFPSFIQSIFSSNSSINSNITVNSNISISNLGNFTMSNNLSNIFNGNQSFTIIANLLPMFFNEQNNYEFNLELQDILGGDVQVGVKQSLSECYDIINNNLEDCEEKQDIKCCICFETYEEKHNTSINSEDHSKSNCCTIKETLFVKTKCNHYYCKSCIDEWFKINSKCPICMHDFNDIELDAEKN